MSHKEVILKALDGDLPMSLEGLATETGIEKPTLSATLTVLKNAGKCHRGIEGWLLGASPAGKKPSAATLADDDRAAATTPPGDPPGVHRALAEFARQLWKEHALALVEVRIGWTFAKGGAGVVSSVSMMTQARDPTDISAG